MEALSQAMSPTLSFDAAGVAGASALLYFLLFIFGVPPDQNPAEFIIP